MSGLNKILFKSAVLVLAVLTTTAQINETEPNNDCSDEGILKIQKNGTYSGTVVDGDPDWWRIVPRKNGYVRISISVDTDNYLYQPTFELYRSHTYELDEECVWIYQVGDYGFDGEPVRYEVFAKSSRSFLPASKAG